MHDPRVLVTPGAFATLLTGDTSAAPGDGDTFAFARGEGDEAVVVALNQGNSANTVAIPVGDYYPDGTVLNDALAGSMYAINGGVVTLTLAPRSGVLLLSQGGLTTRAATQRSADAVAGPQRQ